MNDKEENKSIPSTATTGSLVSLKEFDNFFDDFLARRWPRAFDLSFPAMATLEKNFPKVDIIDRDNEIEILAALPGVKKEDLDVSINDRTISIRTSTREEKKEEGKYFRREITRGECQRTLSLPGNVDYEKAKATFKDGILNVVVAKTEQGKRKNIEIED